METVAPHNSSGHAASNTDLTRMRILSPADGREKLARWRKVGCNGDRRVMASSISDLSPLGLKDWGGHTLPDTAARSTSHGPPLAPVAFPKLAHLLKGRCRAIPDRSVPSWPIDQISIAVENPNLPGFRSYWQL